MLTDHVLGSFGVGVIFRGDISLNLFLPKAPGKSTLRHNIYTWGDLIINRERAAARVVLLNQVYPVARV